MGQLTIDVDNNGMRQFFDNALLANSAGNVLRCMAAECFDKSSRLRWNNGNPTAMDQAKYWDKVTAVIDQAVKDIESLLND